MSISRSFNVMASTAVTISGTIDETSTGAGKSIESCLNNSSKEFINTPQICDFAAFNNSLVKRTISADL